MPNNSGLPKHFPPPLAALAALGILALSAPAYLGNQGFPLDDAWIHLVYGRELAREGSLSYNPGIPATGSTSLLWAGVLALVHLVGGSADVVVPLVKVTGFLLHMSTASLLLVAFNDGKTGSSAALLGSILVAFHPDLVAASVSGMEVPLATLVAAGLVLLARTVRFWPYLVLSALAPLARPEVSLLCFCIPFLLFAGRDRVALRRLGIAAFAGAAVAWSFLIARNFAVSGLPLPATFYVKAARGVGLKSFTLQYFGYTNGLRYLPLVDSLILLGAVAIIAGLVLSRWRTEDKGRIAAAALLAGLIYCAVTFAMVPFNSPDTFYFKRYVLPALPLMVSSIPALMDVLIVRSVPEKFRAVARVAGCVALIAIPAAGAPGRFARLSNDARNIDDLQVAQGRFLAGAARSDIVWATDAGAVRYFGSAFVVDLIGLNTPELVKPSPQTYLDAHRPTYIQCAPFWIMFNDELQGKLVAVPFSVSTTYTVSPDQTQGKQWLVGKNPGVEGRLTGIVNYQFKFAEDGS